ncbi:hypothetical protein [uncultured Cyclobacterium sp.]|uniref:hypothetical protein n=1 Tax=uncultured Cyclobacterium sp. TaxID=453820 RepID=UPI0030EC58D9|tara:strand:- start:4175 stop:4531 length:357 start_codon:yes stop_codon:yes gene_type:complete
METKDENIVDWGDESTSSESSSSILRTTKEIVNEYDIFRLANWILAICAFVYISFGLIRIYYPGYQVVENGLKVYKNEGIVEVWEYTKVFLNSIISLILGLYFGAKAQARKTNSQSNL